MGECDGHQSVELAVSVKRVLSESCRNPLGCHGPVKCPVLFTHHFRMVDDHGRLLGASSDVQTGYVRKLVTAAGQPFEYRSFPKMGHSINGRDPALFTKTLVEWAATLSQD